MPEVINPRKVTGVTNISQACCGAYFSTIQDINGTVYSCGSNEDGQLGLGHTKEQQKTFVPLSLPDISSFSCGYSHQAFITSVGDFFAVGCNENGQLGTGDNINRSTAVHISALANITKLSCGSSRTIVINDNEQVFAFGAPESLSREQLYNSPRALDLQYACTLSQGGSDCTLIGDRNGKVWVYEFMYKILQFSLVDLGDEYNGIISLSTRNRREKGWRVVLEWTDEDIHSLHDIIKCLQSLKTEILEQEQLTDIPQTSAPFNSWKEAQNFLESKLSVAVRFVDQFAQSKAQSEQVVNKLAKEVRDFEERLAQMRRVLAQAKDRQVLLEDLPAVKHAVDTIKLHKTSVQKLVAHESNLTRKKVEFHALMQEKSLPDFSEDDVSLALWIMGLSRYKQGFVSNHVNGKLLVDLSVPMCAHLGMNKRDACILVYHVRMMSTSKYLQEDKSGTSECIICFHNTVERTLDLLEEHEVPLPKDIITEQQWTAPSLLYCDNYKEAFNISSFQDWATVKQKMKEWEAIHFQQCLRWLSAMNISPNP
eukprot:CAMPEP_0206191756 /NCGR_PEP_ID=MMETSP0166-20121206/5545_1 /ASSEMBLY_ACC=CAM_ASM_000260 /TAXON_ID=95228 /ORGANISM="Vannella robusta, Strain DIVA3 518/3/11/1/6" /LENGTH=538 /DNA_ID=CAMNT_0053608107 /DNA_START=1267 /DNA_END=2883 /DNA_ORIENTATION=-